MYCLILLWEIRCIKSIRQLGCVYRQQNYSAYALMLYTKWTPCNGTDCPLGLQKRLKGICCPFSPDGRMYVHVLYTGVMNANNFNNSTACISTLLSTIFTYLLNKFLEKNVIDFSACYSTVAVLITGR